METDSFTPLGTADIPIPIVDPGGCDTREGPLPRSLAQAAGRTRARRGMVAVLGVLLLQVALEGALFARLSRVAALVVYRAGSPARLVRR